MIIVLIAVADFPPMSREAREWAWAQTVGQSSAKSVLVVLGDVANSAGGSCFPSIDFISKKTELGVRTVQRSLDYLVEKKFIERVRSTGGKGHSNSYELSMKPCQGDTVSDPKPRHSDTHKPCHTGTISNSNPVTVSCKPCHHDHLTGINKIKIEKIQIPESIDLEAFQDFVEFRKEKKNPLTDRGKTIALNKLKVHPKEIQREMVNRSILGGWSGIFELKNLPNSKKSANGAITKTLKMEDYK